MHNKGVSALEEVNAYVFRAGELLKLSKDFIKAFSTSERELIISIPLRRESGGIDVLTGYRIQHSSARGPRKGGIRYATHPIQNLAHPTQSSWVHRAMQRIAERWLLQLLATYRF